MRSNHGKTQKFTLPLAELIDRWTVDQIKEVLLPRQSKSVKKEIKSLSASVDDILKNKKIEFNSRLLGILIALSQINLHIWFLKDRMQEDKRKYSSFLKRAHQLNGIRNQLKNILLYETGDLEPSKKRTNFSTDGLKGWGPSFLEMK